MNSENTRQTNRESDLAVMGVDEYKQKRRLERILNDIDAIGDKSREAWEQYVKGEITHEGKNITIQQNVREAILDCKPMLKKYVEKFDGRDPYWKGNPNDPIGLIEQHRNANIVIVGLEDYLEQPQIRYEEWEETVKPRNRPKKSISRQIRHTVPEMVSREAAARLLTFLSEERGIKLSTEQKEVEVHADPW